MTSPIKDTQCDFKCGTVIKELIPRGSVIASYLLYGGAVELDLARTDRFVCAHAARTTIHEFWNCLLTDPQRVCDIVRANAEAFTNEDMFHLLQETWATYGDPYVRASLFYLLNRCSEKGTVSSGELDIAQFNPLALARLQSFKAKNFYLNPADDAPVFQVIPSMSEADYTLLPVGAFSYNLFDSGKATSFETTVVKHEELALKLAAATKPTLLLYKKHSGLEKVYGEFNITRVDKYGRRTNEFERTEDVIIANF